MVLMILIFPVNKKTWKRNDFLSLLYKNELLSVIINIIFTILIINHI
jgi:hypothetical protein